MYSMIESMTDSNRQQSERVLANLYRDARAFEGEYVYTSGEFVPRVYAWCGGSTVRTLQSADQDRGENVCGWATTARVPSDGIQTTVLQPQTGVHAHPKHWMGVHGARRRARRVQDAVRAGQNGAAAATAATAHTCRARAHDLVFVGA